MKYKTLKALKAAYDSGEISKRNKVWLDNDCSGLSDNGGERLFEGGGPEEMLREALTLLGIPHEGV